MRWVLGLLAVSTMAVGLGCAGPSRYVTAESQQWGAFSLVRDGALGPGVTPLPTPVQQGYCYRVIIGTDSTVAPQLAYAGEMDAQSVGFPIQLLQRRTGRQDGGTVAVFGFCSQQSGNVALRANVDAPSHAALLQAPFSALGPTYGADVIAAHDWLVEQERLVARRRAEQEQAQREAALAAQVESVREELRLQTDELVRSRGRYPSDSSVVDEVLTGGEWREALVLEPGRCYLFAVRPYGQTAVQVDLQFGRIRNAAIRSDEGGGVTYAVCTAPSGPVQEVTLSAGATVPADCPHPPIFAVRLTHRAPSTTERQQADAEWLRNDPEASIE